MFNVDEPGFPIALLAILAGLRLAVYVAERLTLQPAEAPAAPLLAPDAPVEAQPLVLQTDEASAPALPATTSDMTDQADAVWPFRALAELLDSGLIAVLLVFCLIRPFILQAFFIPTGSMIPTLMEGDKLLAAKFVYHLHPPRNGDVVVFHAPKIALDLMHMPYDDKHPTEYVKRVIGIPGDRIRIKAYDGVYVNDVKLREPYLKDLPNYDFPVTGISSELFGANPEVRKALHPHIRDQELVVPDKYLFVLGDNRTQSHDGHIWGLLPRDRVIGKALFIFWPFNRWGFIH